jgi:hypothetical protein
MFRQGQGMLKPAQNQHFRQKNLKFDGPSGICPDKTRSTRANPRPLAKAAGQAGPARLNFL